MSFFSKIFNRTKKDNLGYPDVKFGRFAKPSENEELLDLKTQADELFESGQYLDAYVTFFDYMQKLGGPAVLCEIDNDTNDFIFKLLQGSKIVSGVINQTDILVESKVAKFSGENIALMRYLLSQNTKFAYTKYAIDGDTIYLRQRCPIKDMSPQSFSDMLSEIAICADSTDEYLETEFANIIPVDYENIIPLDANELRTKIEFLRVWIKESFELIEKCKFEKFKPYLLLALVYKILYLISPEGALLNRFRKILSIYSTYDKEEDNMNEVFYKMDKELHAIAELSDSELEKSLYRTYAVFPELEYMTFAEMVDSVVELLRLPLKAAEANMDDEVVPLCEFIVGYHLNLHGMPDAASELLLIFWRTLNSEYFYGIGFTDTFYNETVQQLAQTRIAQEIERINAKYSVIYPGFQFNLLAVDMSTLEDFAYTFLLEFKNLQIPE